jgi:hypothetical protein
MVLAKLTKDVTSWTVSMYDFLERGHGGGRFSDLGGCGGSAPAAQGAWAADALGAERAGVGAVGALEGGTGRFVSSTVDGLWGLGGLLEDVVPHPQEEGAGIGDVFIGQGVPATLTAGANEG